MNTDTDPRQEYERKILRQLKLLNFFMAFFGLMFIGLIVGGVFVGYTVVTFVNNTQKQITNFEQTTTEKLDVKSQVCNGTDSFSAFIKSNTDACR